MTFKTSLVLENAVDCSK